jgi:hypothetical protein
MSPEQSDAFEQRRRTFEVQVASIVAIGPILKVNFKIRKVGHPDWSYLHFFGAGPAASVELPIESREGAVETHTVRHPMRVRDLVGAGRVWMLGVPRTNIRHMRLVFVDGPERAGYSPIEWNLRDAAEQAFGVGGYFGAFGWGWSPGG